MHQMRKIGQLGKKYGTGNWQHEVVAWQINKCARLMRNDGAKPNDETSQIKPW
jgi:hypothetical protein